MKNNVIVHGYSELSDEKSKIEIFKGDENIVTFSYNDKIVFTTEEDCILTFKFGVKKCNVEVYKDKQNNIEISFDRIADKFSVNNFTSNFDEETDLIQLQSSKINNNDKKYEENNVGNSVHVYNGWDLFKPTLIIDIILCLFFAIIIGDLGLAIVGILPMFLIAWIIKTILVSMNILPLRESGLSISYSCPYCNNKVSCFMPSKRMKCPSCKEEIGFDGERVYKITKDNEDKFKTEQEKTNSLLEKQFNKQQNSYLEELKQLKELLDVGAITQEEYNKKKKELLK